MRHGKGIRAAWAALLPRLEEQEEPIVMVSHRHVRKHRSFLLFLLWCVPTGYAQQPEQREIVIPNATQKLWWSGVINQGEEMPLHNGYSADLTESNYGNQVQPILLSHQGDLIWSEDPMRISVEKDVLKVTSTTRSLHCIQAGTTLREACRYASVHFFPPAGKMPEELLFAAPQYNTWIELMYDQNQEDILNYARQIVAHGFPPGVLMIDDNWQEDYGKWTFHPGRFPDPNAMMRSLHEMGFQVMVWVCPFVSPDSDVYRSLRDQGLLCKDSSGKAAVVRWWNGASGLLDLANPKARQWFKSQLANLQATCQVDGFKLDAGDFHHYAGCQSHGQATPQEQCQWYARVGLDYPLNEYRAMWKMAGQPLVNRLRDKSHSWEDLQKLIPDILLQGLVGYSFTCPDMIGGGSFTSFLPGHPIDQDLIVRSAQCHALMPMMQFSVAPWRILDPEHLEACKKAIQVRAKYTPTILKLARQAARNGTPIVRSMEYVFPHQGYGNVRDQFLLGDHILVAPLVVKGPKQGKSIRSVALPAGTWKDWRGKIHQGPNKLRVEVALDGLPVFEQVVHE